VISRSPYLNANELHFTILMCIHPLRERESEPPSLAINTPRARFSLILRVAAAKLYFINARARTRCLPEGPPKPRAHNNDAFRGHSAYYHFNVDLLLRATPNLISRLAVTRSHSRLLRSAEYAK
jgi:hypothetical protein